MVAACVTSDAPPPEGGSSALSLGECPGLPVSDFLSDALLNLAGVSPEEVTQAEAMEILLDLIELGSSAPGLAKLAGEVRSGELDEELWPSLAGLPARDGETTIAAALIEMDPDFALRCELLRAFGDGPPRTVEELALIVNQSHGYPVSDEEMLEQPFQTRVSPFWTSRGRGVFVPDAAAQGVSVEGVLEVRRYRNERACKYGAKRTGRSRPKGRNPSQTSARDRIVNWEQTSRMRCILSLVTRMAS